MQCRGEAACVACYSLQYTWESKRPVLVHKCTKTPLLGTSFIKKENTTDFLCVKVNQDAASLYMCVSRLRFLVHKCTKRQVLGQDCSCSSF